MTRTKALPSLPEPKPCIEARDVVLVSRQLGLGCLKERSNLTALRAPAPRTSNSKSKVLHRSGYPNTVLHRGGYPNVVLHRGGYPNVVLHRGGYPNVVLHKGGYPNVVLHRGGYPHWSGEPELEALTVSPWTTEGATYSWRFCYVTSSKRGFYRHLHPSF